MTPMIRQGPNQARGFTLAELAVVLVIIGLLLGGLFMPLSAQREAQAQRDTEKTLASAMDAILGFAAANRRLPCPATSTSNGQENFATGSDASDGNCSNFYDGFLPAATLGLSPVDQDGFALDAWNQPIRYAVYTDGTDNYFTKNNGIKTAGMATIASAAALSVCSTATGITATACGTAIELTEKAPAVLFSTGKNSAWGGTGSDEAANLDNNPVFISHTPTPTGATNGEFDDIVVWLSSNILFSRMIAAGTLP
ncbi:MAG: type II secretion system protein [Georgfuchsia sp.]